MIGIGIGVNRQRFRGGGGGFDADYQAVLNYATTQGYTLPSAGQQVLQNQLVVDLKSGGIWSKLDTFAVFATDGGSDFALIDWKRLVLMTAVNSPTFTTNQGFNGNGTSSYIDSNFNPATQGVNYTRLNASRYYYQFGIATSITADGVGSDGNYNKFRLLADTSSSINTSNTSSVNSPYNLTQGFKSIHRIDASNIVMINATTSVSATQLVNASLNSENQLILRRGTSYSTNKLSCHAMGASLVSENSSFVTAFNTYITSL